MKQKELYIWSDDSIKEKVIVAVDSSLYLRNPNTDQHMLYSLYIDIEN